MIWTSPLERFHSVLLLMKIYVIPDGLEQKRFDLNFGWVYSVKNTDSDQTIAVVVNEKYRKAVIKE